MQASDSSNSTKWVFSLEGGGECVDQSSCDGRTKGALGSSKYFSKVAGLGQLQSEDERENPVSGACFLWLGRQCVEGDREYENLLANHDNRCVMMYVCATTRTSTAGIKYLSSTALVIFIWDNRLPRARRSRGFNSVVITFWKGLWVHCWKKAWERCGIRPAPNLNLLRLAYPGRNVSPLVNLSGRGTG